jgi:hypothetical protein
MNVLVLIEIASALLLGVNARKCAKLRVYLRQASLSRRDTLGAAVRNGDRYIGPANLGRKEGRKRRCGAALDTRNA